MKLGLDLFSLRRQGWTIFQHLDYCHGIGLDVVMIPDPDFLESLDDEYLRRVKHMTGARDQLAAFLKALLSAVEETPQAAVVYTLALRPDGQGSDAFAEENQFIARAMAELESVPDGRRGPPSCTS